MINIMIYLLRLHIMYDVYYFIYLYLWPHMHTFICCTVYVCMYVMYVQLDCFKITFSQTKTFDQALHANQAPSD